VDGVRVLLLGTFGIIPVNAFVSF